MSDAPLMAILYIEPHLLAELVHIEASRERRGCLKMVLRGAGWPTPFGNEIPVGGPATVVSVPVIKSIDWGLPK